MKFYTKTNFVQVLRSAEKPDKVWYNSNGSVIVFDDSQEDAAVLEWILKNQEKLRADRVNLGQAEIDMVFKKEKAPRGRKPKTVEA